MENIDSYIFSANENNLYLLTRATASTHELIEYDIKTQKQRSIDSGNIASLGLSPGDQFLYYTKTGADGKSTVVRSLIFEGGYQIPGVSVVYW
jgi:hypothetical protein